MKLKGAAELSAFLDALPKTLAKNAVRSALTAAAKPIRDQARANVPKKTGKLAKAIKTSNPRLNQDGSVSVKVKLDGPHSYLGLWVEFGTAAHLITAGDADLTTRALNKRARKSGVLQQEANGLIRVGGYEYHSGPMKGREERDALKINDKFVSGAVMHPGNPARPFLRPALDSRATDAVNAFGEKLQAYLRGKIGVTLPLIEVEAEE